MACKHLNELLNEDQEPFVLHNYIHDKLKRSTPKTHLHLNKRKPISQNSSFSRNFCKNACFLSSHSPSPSPSPDVRKSPLLLKSPCRNHSFVHIPARTAALLLEAALRIQKNSSLKKTKSRNKASGFGLFGSILKRITNKKRNPKNEFDQTQQRVSVSVSVSVKDIIRWDSSKSFNNKEITMGFEDKTVSDVGCSCSNNSSVWSESNEDKSFDLESSSSRSDDSEDMEFVNQQMEKELFCSSPFRFVLHNNTLSPCRSSPSKFDIFGTPRRSPTHNNQQVVDIENGSSNDARTKYEEDDKEQNSPVSVLDPPFEDDDYQEDDDEHNFTDMQRAKQLLQNLRRFERLAEFDPVDLEKRIAEQEDEDREVEKQYEECCSLDNEKIDSAFVRELLTRSNMYNHQRIPSDMKRLVLDLVAEEAGEATAPCSRKLVAEKVCKRLESWKEVEYNTIDMMVEFDFRRDADDWAKHPEHTRETANEIGVAIFGFLMEELSDELVQCSSH